jgi:translation elongation factor EF-Ts
MKEFVTNAMELKHLFQTLSLKLHSYRRNKQDMRDYPNNKMIEAKTYLNSKLLKEINDLRSDIQIHIALLDPQFIDAEDFENWFYEETQH